MSAPLMVELSSGLPVLAFWLLMAQNLPSDIDHAGSTGDLWYVYWTYK